MRAPAHDDIQPDPQTEWSQWVEGLPETAKSVLTDPASDRATVYRELFEARKIGFGAILLELLAFGAG